MKYRKKCYNIEAQSPLHFPDPDKLGCNSESREEKSRGGKCLFALCFAALLKFLLFLQAKI